jgi:small subunit ribosomal protein S6
MKKGENEVGNFEQAEGQEQKESKSEQESKKEEKPSSLREIREAVGEKEEYISEKIKKAIEEGKNFIEENGRLKRLKDYEFTVVISPDLGEKKEKELIDAIKDFIERKVGKIIYEKSEGEKELAYRIKKYDRGKFFYIEYKSTGRGEEELRKFLETEEYVLRYLIVRKEKIETKGHIWRAKMKKELSQ